MKVICDYCGEYYPAARRDLGYRTCLDCGELHALQEKDAKAKCVTIAYNKGPYMLITSKESVKGIFKVGEGK